MALISFMKTKIQPTSRRWWRTNARRASTAPPTPWRRAGESRHENPPVLVQRSEPRYKAIRRVTFAERATDWRGNNNIAESIFSQMKAEPHPVPRWIVVGAGTGGTSATIGRYIRYQGLDAKLCVVDPTHSVFHRYYESGDAGVTIERGSDVEGIGRPRVEASFIPGVIDRMIVVPNEGSYAAMRYLARMVGRRYGASTGTDFYGALRLACEMKEQGQVGSIVTMACDPGERYLDTYYSDAWLAKAGYDIAPYEEQIRQAIETGRWHEIGQ